MVTLVGIPLSLLALSAKLATAQRLTQEGHRGAKLER